MHTFSKYVSVAIRMIAPIILLQTLFFKFTAHPDSVYIFSQLGIEPWGRIATGVVELIAAILIFLPATAWLGAILAAGTILGAIFSHLTVLGISVNGDHGQLFILAILVLLSSLYTIYNQRARIKEVIFHFKLQQSKH